MIGLDDLYQDLILDHAKHPRHFGAPADEGAEDYRDAEGFNPLCGDKIHIWLLLENDVITDIKFTGKACAICTASASLMTEALLNAPQAEAEAIFGKFHGLLTEKHDAADAADAIDDLGELAALSGVLKYPMRVKCATLPWHTFKAALEKNTDAPVSTE